jgi:hypothetical protein
MAKTRKSSITRLSGDVSGGVDPRDFGGATRFYGDVDFSAADG